MRRRMDRAGMALFATFAATLVLVTGSFLPLFFSGVWAPLWGIGGWGAGEARSLTRVGPLVGLSAWPVFLAVPLASCLVLAAFALLVTVLVLSWRGNATQPR